MFNSLILSVAVLLLGLYFFHRLWPRQKWLHRRNQKIAAQVLKKVNQLAPSHPAQVFGLLRHTNPFVFEELLLMAFKHLGYTVKHNVRYTGDKGIDGTVYDKQGRKFLIQAKRYGTAINPVHVHHFAQALARECAYGGYFIHTGRTGMKSKQNRTANIQIISGNRLIKLLQGDPAF